jgi:hypothetical protein
MTADRRLLSADRRPPTRSRWLVSGAWTGWRAHLGALGVYGLLSLLLAWPLARDFTTRIVSDGGDDARLNIWMLWHTQQVLLGRQPLFDAPLLYYPLGTSLWTQSPGPLTGLFALPFWPWGAEAAYNGAFLICLTLTGYCMYLLARALGFERGIAFFAGVVLLTAPICLGGLYQHIDKTFLGLLPLALLCALRAFDPTRSRWWAVATAVVLLLTVLHAGWHFVLAGFGVALMVISAIIWRVKTWSRGFSRSSGANEVSTNAPELLKASTLDMLGRVGLLLACVAVLVGPLLWQTTRASSNPDIQLNRNLQSFEHHPDLAQFVLPSAFARGLGEWAAAWGEARGIIWDTETAVFLTWTALALSLVALLGQERAARRWGLLALVCAVFALGPSLRVLGQRQFTEFGLPIILPYAFLTGLPGLEFMRTPGRFMMLGFVAFGITASYGLAWLTRRFPAWRGPLVAGALLLVLAESWPQTWPQEMLRPVPEFYQQIASDREMYGVFDLPMKLRSSLSGVGLSSFYQVYQMTHGKGIASGFVSATYVQHPLFPCLFAADPTPPDILVNGQKVSCHVNAQYELARYGYRYVVQHQPQSIYSDYKPGSQGDKLARQFIQTAFPNTSPIVNDDLVTVYAIPPTVDLATLTPLLEVRDGWDEREDAWRWARSPATLYIVSPRAQAAVLEITPAALYDPGAPGGVGTQGRLKVQTAQGELTVDLATDQVAHVPLTLVPGSQTITLTLERGNFRPADYGVPDTRTLSFSLRRINLRL